MHALKILLFVLICLAGAAFGAMQCFAPAKLLRVQKRYWDKGDWSDSAGGKWFDDFFEREVRNPSVSYRLSGLGLMAMFLLAMVYIGRLVH